ncbi:MAG TPA: glycosyltransferase family 4 protein [Bryobacterales bacterium]|nr:glycosyltransferase family 4 protein [Bryobacterales bacterium]
MRVLFLDQFSDLGGAQKCLLDLLPAMRDIGWSAHVAAPGQGPLRGRAADAGATVSALPTGRYRSGKKSFPDGIRFLLEIPRLAHHIRALIGKHRPDILYVNGPRLLPAASRATRNTPLLFHCHNHLHQRFAAALAGRALRRSAATVVACCRFVAEPLQQYVSPDKIHTVENGVVEGPERSGGFNINQARIGMVARISPEKGHIEFLEAAERLAEAFPHCQFLIAGGVLFGDPAARSYHEQVRARSEGLPVKFLGWQDDIYSVMRGLDILVVPSTREPGMPRVILEAQACGLPIVAFATGGIPEALSDGETGFLVRPSSGTELAAKLIALLLHSPGRIQAAGRAGRQAWQKRFTLERFQRQMIERIRIAAGRPLDDSPGNPTD